MFDPFCDGSPSRIAIVMHHRHRIQLAARVCVLRDQREVTVSLKRSLAMIVILALSTTASVTRERVTALLWSDSDQATARNSLRQTLHRLRQELGATADGLLSWRVSPS